MVQCNTTLEDLPVGNETLLSIGITFHHLGLILCAAFGLTAVTIASYLILQHANHYLKPWEQKHIIRVLFMIPIYAVVSFVSYYDYTHAIYWEILRDCYEAFAIASFFTLLCHYIAPNLHEQKDFFRTTKPKNWIWPVTWLQKCTGGQDKGWLRKPQSGLTWFNVVWVGVFQYCLIRVFFTIVSGISQYFGRYCAASLNPAFVHIWAMVFEGAAVLVAMYMLIQFYYQLKDDLSEHRPFLKLACIKLVIFLSFWQTLIISFLSSSTGPLKPTQYLSYPDIKVGIPSLLLCIEMALFALLHIFAFPWKRPYSISSNNMDLDPLHAHGSGFSGKPHYVGGPLGWRALASAFNPWDFVKASARGFRWLFVGRKSRHEDSSYMNHMRGGEAGAGGGGSGGGGGGGGATGLRPLKTRDNGIAPIYATADDVGQQQPYNHPRRHDVGVVDGAEDEDTAYRGASHRSAYPMMRTADNGNGRRYDEQRYDGRAAAAPFDKDTEDRAGLIQHAASHSGAAVHPAFRHDYGAGGMGMAQDSDDEGGGGWEDGAAARMPSRTPRGGWI